jgi:hypothetical protein
MDIEEGAEVEAKRTGNIHIKVIAENFPNLEKDAYPVTGSLYHTKET